MQDIEGEVLCGGFGCSEILECAPLTVDAVSQFTLYGQLKKGSKPDFHDAADAETARKLYEYFFRRLGEAYKPDRVKNGVFQAMMDVELKNDGPVGVDYRSEDAAVSFCSSSSYLVSDRECQSMLTTSVNFRSQSRSTPNWRRRRNPRRDRISRRANGKMERRRPLSLNYQHHCWNKELTYCMLQRWLVAWLQCKY